MAKMGRPPGSPNKFTKSIKDVFKAVFEDLQADEGAPYTLKEWAKNNPGDYYKLANKMVPQGLEVAGADGGPIQVTVEKIADSDSQ